MRGAIIAGVYLIFEWGDTSNGCLTTDNIHNVCIVSKRQSVNVVYGSLREDENEHLTVAIDNYIAHNYMWNHWNRFL